MQKEGLFKNEYVRKKKGIPFVVTFLFKLSGLSSIVRKHLNLLYQDSTVKAVFTRGPFVCFRSGMALNLII